MARTLKYLCGHAQVRGLGAAAIGQDPGSHLHMSAHLGKPLSGWMGRRVGNCAFSNVKDSLGKVGGFNPNKFTTLEI